MPENFTLPVVHKAQPFWVCLTCGTQEVEPAENCKQNSIQVAHYSVIEEERLGYEKREQALKQKIREIVGLLEKDILYRSHHPKFKWIAGSNTLKARNELLGLSKQ